MTDAKIELDIELNSGPKKGQTIMLATSIEELEEEDISTLLIEKGYLDSWCNDNEYSVIARRIEVWEDDN